MGKKDFVSTAASTTTRKIPERRTPAQILRDAAADIYRTLPKMAAAGITCSPLTQAAEVCQEVARQWDEGDTGTILRQAAKGTA